MGTDSSDPPRAPGFTRIVTVTPSDTQASASARPSAIGRLLDEISWEGNARKYRGGGLGRENVLTVEVFSALDFLPRAHFLGRILLAARGAEVARGHLIRDIDAANIDLLPGDLRPTLPSGQPAEWTVQPDATISTTNSLCLVEAKRLKPSSFQPQQLARLAAAIADLNGSQSAFCLLVLRKDPPVNVKGYGYLTLAEALMLGDRNVGKPDTRLIDKQFAVITWDEIQRIVADQVQRFANVDASVESSIGRLAREVIQSVARHQ